MDIEISLMLYFYFLISSQMDMKLLPLFRMQSVIYIQIYRTTVDSFWLHRATYACNVTSNYLLPAWNNKETMKILDGLGKTRVLFLILFIS